MYVLLCVLHLCVIKDDDDDDTDRLLFVFICFLVHCTCKFLADRSNVLTVALCYSVSSVCHLFTLLYGMYCG